jgi:hypothetical protein
MFDMSEDFLKDLRSENKPYAFAGQSLEGLQEEYLENDEESKEFCDITNSSPESVYQKAVLIDLINRKFPEFRDLAAKGLKGVKL